jgi:peroxiredoxin
MVAVNSPAPAFALPDLGSRIHRLEEYLGRIVLLDFWSGTCPWSVRADREIAKWPAGLASGVVILRLAMNADEPVEALRQTAADRHEGILLLDSDRKTTNLYGVLVTPEFFLLDRAGLVRYHGAFDDTTFRQPAPTRPYVEDALRALLDGRNPDPAEAPAYGCAIVRWKI